MTAQADKFYLHIIPVEKSLNIQRCSFTPAVLDQLKLLVGDRSGQCYVEMTRGYFYKQPLFVIAADDSFANKGWPVCAVINKRWFRGALVILAERPRDPAAPPLQGETCTDGLTTEECDEASRWISGPPGTPWLKWVFKNRAHY